MKIFLLHLLFASTAYAVTMDVYQPRKVLRDFFESYETKYKNEKFLTSPDYSYDVDICLAHKTLSNCDIFWCVVKSRHVPSSKWIKIAEDRLQNKCEIHEIEESLRHAIENIKRTREKCLMYKVYYKGECVGVLEK